MPITKSARKKLRQDVKHREFNLKILSKLKQSIRTLKRQPGTKNLQTAYSVIDTAAKKHVIHKNTAARLKSRLTVASNKPKPVKPAQMKPKDKVTKT